MYMIFCTALGRVSSRIVLGWGEGTEVSMHYKDHRSPKMEKKGKELRRREREKEAESWREREREEARK